MTYAIVDQREGHKLLALTKMKAEWFPHHKYLSTVIPPHTTVYFLYLTQKSWSAWSWHTETPMRATSLPCLWHKIVDCHCQNYNINLTSNDNAGFAGLNTCTQAVCSNIGTLAVAHCKAVVFGVGTLGVPWLVPLDGWPCCTICR